VHGSIRKIAVAGMMGALSIVMGIVPGLGFIPVPTVAGKATIMHLPVIIAAIAEGPVVGLMVGLIFGLMSFLQATAPAFADPLVAIFPRLFIGVFAALAYRSLLRFGQVPALIGAAVVGTATNTGLVLTMGVLRGYWPPAAALGVALTHGVPEVVVASIAVTAVGLALARTGVIARASRSGHSTAS